MCVGVGGDSGGQPWGRGEACIVLVQCWVSGLASHAGAKQPLQGRW